MMDSLVSREAFIGCLAPEYQLVARFNAAMADVRRDALEEAAKVCDNVVKHYTKHYEVGGSECARQIRSLIDSQEE